MPGITLKFLNGLVGAAVAAIRTLQEGVENTPTRAAYNFKGTGVSVADNAGLGCKDVTIPGVSADASSVAPPSIGASNVQGSSLLFAREDHTHAHGTQTVDTMHALAVAGTSHGFLDKADKTKLNGATAAATASTLCARGSSAECAFGAVVGDSFTLTTIGAGFSSGAGVAGHGTPTTLKGSTNATAGHPGGTTSIWSSPGGTPGTDAASDVVVDVLDPVTGVTAKFAIETLGTRFFGVGKSASTDTRLDLGASKVVDGASFLTIESGTGIDVCINARPGQNGTFLVQANSANFPVLDFYVRASGSRYLIHAATPAIAGSAGDVLGICSGAAVNATKMPAGTVDRGVFWGKANAVPTVGCDNTGNQLYVDPTTLAVCAFEHGGTLHHFTAYDASLAAAPSAAPVTIRHPTARYKTTATGAVTIAKILGADIPSKSIGGAIVRVRCRDTVDDTAFQGLRQVEWDKTGGGTLTCTVTTLGADRGSLCTLSITVSSGDIIIQVNPSKADDIRHYVKVDFDNCQD